MRQNIKIILLLLHMCLMLNACELFRNLDKSVTEVPENHDIILIGFKPKYRYSMKMGYIKDGKYKYQPNRVTAGSIYPDDSGYIITKLEKTEPNHRYGITQIQPEGISLGGPMMSPCGGRSTYTFDVEGGRVLYLGDLEYTEHENGLKVSYSRNFDKAKQYMKNNYPGLAGYLAEGELTLMEVTNFPCVEQGQMYLRIP